MKTEQHIRAEARLHGMKRLAKDCTYEMEDSKKALYVLRDRGVIEDVQYTDLVHKAQSLAYVNLVNGIIKEQGTVYD